MTNFDITLAMEYGLKISKDNKGRTLKKKKWTKLQVEIGEGKKKDIMSIFSILPNHF